VLSDHTTVGRAKVRDNEGLLPEEIRNPLVLPRYVRVNTLKAQVSDVLPQLSALSSTPEEDGHSNSTNKKRKSTKDQAADDGQASKRSKVDEAEPEEEKNEEEKEKENKEAKSEGEAVRVDDHLCDLLVLPPTVKLGKHPLVQDGTLVLQDKVPPPNPT
jgi:16S rRNA C967 or C1407 C5-methylase (RsmB/RsmF family)